MPPSPASGITAWKPPRCATWPSAWGSRVPASTMHSATNGNCSPARWNAMRRGRCVSVSRGSSTGTTRRLPSLPSFRTRSSGRLSDPHRRGCLLVNSALEVAPHDAELRVRIAAYLDEIAAFFRRNITAAQKAGAVPPSVDGADTASLLLGVVLGIRVLARTNPDRALLEGVARPALALLDGRRPRTRRSFN